MFLQTLILFLCYLLSYIHTPGVVHFVGCSIVLLCTLAILRRCLQFPVVQAQQEHL